MPVVLEWNKGAIDFMRTVVLPSFQGWHLVQMDGTSLCPISEMRIYKFDEHL
jgi:hypothetical protein